jgi:predicted permease
MVRGFWKLLHVDPGFVSKGIVTMRVPLPGTSYPDPKTTIPFWDRLQDAMANIPGVESASMMAGLPPTRRLNANDTGIEGLAPGPDSPQQNVDYWQTVGRHYFETMKIPLIEGRFFNDSDGPQSQLVVVINLAMARHFWKNESPIGRRVKPGFSGPTDPFYTVVGVAADVKNAGMDVPAGTEMYMYYKQMAGVRNFGMNGPSLVLKTNGNPVSVENAARLAVRSIDPALPVANVRTMDEVLALVESRPRFLSLLLTLFSMVALSLAAIGIYGIVSYFVAQRTNEIGIRMALGAQSGDVLRLVVNHGMRMTLVGMALGIGIAFALTRWLSSLFFAVSATDPLTFISISLGLTIVALAACFIPARRATHVDPMVALRYE